MRSHALHAIATVDVAFDLIDDPQVAVDTATILLTIMLSRIPAAARPAMAGTLLVDAIRLLDHQDQPCSTPKSR